MGHDSGNFLAIPRVWVVSLAAVHSAASLHPAPPGSCLADGRRRGATEGLSCADWPRASSGRSCLVIAAQPVLRTACRLHRPTATTSWAGTSPRSLASSASRRSFSSTRHNRAGRRCRCVLSRAAASVSSDGSGARRIDEQMKRCAKACRDCAKECRDMVEHAGHDKK